MSDDATSMDHRADEEAREKVLQIARKARIAMMATYDDKGTAHARPMAAADHEDAEDGGALWFVTDEGSRKIDEIEGDPRVLLTYGNQSDSEWLSIEGRAAIVRDRGKIEELWSEPMRTWFPEGKDSPRLVAVKVDPEAAEYWDSPSGKVLHAYGYLKAAVTGEPPKAGDVAHVDM
ncbi:general stress protein 26 [Hasllibacter halocynthiae]|uniref:General stress protein 26 n=1 Tax=Hasllibacter halocynthiae TaxID=595589 RepID=A0A2T0X4C3_9RHOB|nr:pyridoxamine 5'-phosphate oxidase family protein [Hasllibacter halocynthiae]PRY93755.1 general stress protein 26 [Hasllibacter halocynthiae]